MYFVFVENIISWIQLEFWLKNPFLLTRRKAISNRLESIIFLFFLLLLLLSLHLSSSSYKKKKENNRESFFWLHCTHTTRERAHKSIKTQDTQFRKPPSFASLT
ncbi:hypothetical protein ACOSQ3_027940 [Xanthoceras sorbifolium]